MTLFRILLALMFVALSGYTAVVVAHHGLDLFSVFFGDIAKLMWPGQFNLDFMCLLLLSGLWVSYRHRWRRCLPQRLPADRVVPHPRRPWDPLARPAQRAVGAEGARGTLLRTMTAALLLPQGGGGVAGASESGGGRDP